MPDFLRKPNGGLRRTKAGRRFIQLPGSMSPSTEKAVTFSVGPKGQEHSMVMKTPSIFGGKVRDGFEPLKIIAKNKGKDPETGRRAEVFTDTRIKSRNPHISDALNQADSGDRSGRVIKESMRKNLGLRQIDSAMKAMGFKKKKRTQ